MPLYRKKPVVIQAIQFTGENGDEINQFTGQEAVPSIYDSSRKDAHILTLEGFKPLPVGYYVIEGVAGEIYPCEPSIFEQTYERVE